MVNQFTWQDEYNIGVDVIDKEHRQLFKIINKLFAFREDKRNNQWSCQEGIKYFKSHAVRHFRDEEEYMDSIGFDGREQHRIIHKSFRENTLPVLEKELEKSGYSDESMDHFLGVCAGWLIGHTLTEDLSITGKSIRKWENMLPDEELAAMKKVIVRQMFDMFRLESHLVSDAYGGERFGNGIYYRLVYGTPHGDRQQEIVLAFEENLLINTVGKVMGIQTNKLDSMLVHATRFTARQFVGRMMKHLPSEEPYELIEEDLLSYEQLQTLFETEKLQASLLFDTGGGYFAYCVIAPHLLEKGVGAPIEGETAMDEVERYLERQTSEAQKRSVLVVDDSPIIRHSMQDLLSGDYQVALADSGVAAIRAIALNRPDLVLMDYDMPVCNGRQTLEMLRSEQAFADIPVIFLTGRGDQESVQSVMHLSPAGYLLKQQKPEEIKKKIDSFFQQKNG